VQAPPPERRLEIGVPDSEESATHTVAADRAVTVAPGDLPARPEGGRSERMSVAYPRPGRHAPPTA